MLKPLLSVIVPVYNTEKYLKQCLNSIINQTLKELEIICINDGSTDDSSKILEDYAKKDSRIKIITQKNGGPSSARNAGLKNSTADFITFVDSDDTIELNAYKKIIKNMTDDIDIICFGIQRLGVTSKEAQESDDNYYQIKYERKTLITDDVLFRTDVSLCNKIFRKSVIDKYQLTFPDGLRYEDAYFFNVYCIRSKYIFFIKEIFYNYTRREASIMSETFSNKQGCSIDHLKIAIKIYEYLKENRLLIKHRHYWGMLFFAYLDFALRYEKTKKGQEEIYNLSNSFLKKENISFSDHQDLSRLADMLTVRTLKETQKKCFGLIKIKKSKCKKLFLFAGIPLWRIKYQQNKTKYYLFSILKIWKKKTPQHPQVSVLMPAYNAEKYIKDAIESILSQTFTDFEFIIINDGSTDKTAQIIQEYDDPRIVFIDNHTNQGLVSVLNQGMDIARGKYIARMDADDISWPQRFAKQVYFMDKHKKVGVLGSWFHIFGNGFDRVEKKLKYPKLSDMIETSPVGHPVAMLRKSLFDKHQLRYDPAYNHTEDYELWTRAIKYMKIANLQEVLLDYRWSGENVSNKYETIQNQNSQIVKQKIKKQIKKKKHLLKIMLDDTNILSELRKMNSFSYMPNSGNMGDMLIAGATIQWFNDNNLNWSRVKENETPEYFVYGGGGAWLHEWIDYMKPTMAIMKKAKKVIILPSSFNEVPEFVKTLDERFVVFCREKKSFDYLTSHKTKAKIILDHDMALRMNPNILKVKTHPNKDLEMRAEKLNKIMDQLPSLVNLFRQDSESAGHYKTDFDLSDALGWFSQFESQENITYATQTMLNVLYRFKTVKTDRLHVGIAATLVGADVCLLDNSYGKISGVYNQSLHNLANVQFYKERK